MLGPYSHSLQPLLSAEKRNRTGKLRGSRIFTQCINGEASEARPFTYWGAVTRAQFKENTFKWNKVLRWLLLASNTRYRSLLYLNEFQGVVFTMNQYFWSQIHRILRLKGAQNLFWDLIKKKKWFSTQRKENTLNFQWKHNFPVTHVIVMQAIFRMRYRCKYMVKHADSIKLTILAVIYISN